MPKSYFCNLRTSPRFSAFIVGTFHSVQSRSTYPIVWYGMSLKQLSLDFCAKVDFLFFFFFFCIFGFIGVQAIRNWWGVQIFPKTPNFPIARYISHFGAQYGPPRKWRRGLKIWTPSFLANWDPFEAKTAKIKSTLAKKILRDYIPYRTTRLAMIP